MTKYTDVTYKGVVDNYSKVDDGKESPMADKPSLIDELKGLWHISPSGRVSTEPNQISHSLSVLALTVLTGIMVIAIGSAFTASSVSPGLFFPIEIVPTLGTALPLPTRTPDNEIEIIGDMCGMSDADAAAVLSQPHGWLKGETRYFFHGSWVNMHDLYYVVEDRRRELKKFKRRGRKFNPVECLVMAVSGQIPCRDRKCVISMRLRPGYSDFSVMKQHLEEESYGFISQMRPRTVLDAGANVGYSTLLFALFFPHAKVIAVEPSPTNFEVLRANTQHLPNVVAVHGCLFNAHRSMMLVNGSKVWREGWQYEVADPQTVTDGTGIALQCSTVSQLAQQAGIRGFDYVKMDIEGAEREVMSVAEGYDPVEWLSHVKLLSIESHEKTKKYCNRAIKGALRQSGGWSMAGKSGEYLVFQRNNTKPILL